MEKQLFTEYAPGERKKFLQDNADSIELISYTRRLSHGEITELKDKLSSIAIEINTISLEKKEALERFRDKSKPLDIIYAGLLKKIQNKSESIKEYCFKLVNHEKEMVGYYNEAGELVYSRPITPKERQSTIFNINRKAK